MEPRDPPYPELKATHTGLDGSASDRAVWVAVS
jgi:hypothetical protein